MNAEHSAARTCLSTPPHKEREHADRGASTAMALGMIVGRAILCVSIIDARHSRKPACPCRSPLHGRIDSSPLYCIRWSLWLLKWGRTSDDATVVRRSYSSKHTLTKPTSRFRSLTGPFTRVDGLQVARIQITGEVPDLLCVLCHKDRCFDFGCDQPMSRKSNRTTFI